MMPSNNAALLPCSYSTRATTSLLTCRSPGCGRSCCRGAGVELGWRRKRRVMDPGLLLSVIVGERGGGKGAASVRLHNAVVHLHHTMHTTACDASALVWWLALFSSGFAFWRKARKSSPKIRSSFNVARTFPHVPPVRVLRL